jgi:hypothetical protein
MTEARKVARRIFREWCKYQGICMDPIIAADLIARIEHALAGKS